MEFAATGWCAGKQLRLDRTIRKLDMFDNYYIIIILLTLLLDYFLTKSNSNTEVETKLF